MRRPPGRRAAPAGPGSIRRAYDTVLHRRSTLGTVEIAGEHPPGFAVVDVETTGFSPEQEQIVEVAVVILSPTGEEVDTFCTLVDPGRPTCTASPRRCWWERRASRRSIPIWPTGSRAGSSWATTSTGSTWPSCRPSAGGPGARPWSPTCLLYTSPSPR